jgi:hypothetical protein
MVESDIILWYIWSHVWEIIYVVGPDVATVQTPRRSFPCDVRQRKVLDIAIDELSRALFMHVVPPAKRIVCGTSMSDSPVWTL